MPSSQSAASPVETLSAGVVPYGDAASLPTVAAFAKRHGLPVIVRDPGASGLLRSLVGDGHPAPLIADVGHWRNSVGAPDRPTILRDPLALFSMDIDEWGSGFLAETRASAALAPARFVQPADWQTLSELVDDLTKITIPGVIPFIPTGPEMLDSPNLSQFERVLSRLVSSPIALLFAGGREALASLERLRGLRDVLARHDGAWLIGVDPLVAADSIVHGAAISAVGTRSGLRWPGRPGEPHRGFDARDFVPGLFNRPLMSHRSPSIYADWYIDDVAPICPICRRSVDQYTSSEADKVAVVEHNLHAVREFTAELLNQPGTNRNSWLRGQREDAFMAHRALNPNATRVEADRTLRALCGIDDPSSRMTTPIGTWI